MSSTYGRPWRTHAVRQSWPKSPILKTLSYSRATGQFGFKEGTYRKRLPLSSPLRPMTTIWKYLKCGTELDEIQFFSFHFRFGYFGNNHQHHRRILSIVFHGEIKWKSLNQNWMEKKTRKIFPSHAWPLQAILAEIHCRTQKIFCAKFNLLFVFNENRPASFGCAGAWICWSPAARRSPEGLSLIISVPHSDSADKWNETGSLWWAITCACCHLPLATYFYWENDNDGIHLNTNFPIWKS